MITQKRIIQSLFILAIGAGLAACGGGGDSGGNNSGNTSGNDPVTTPTTPGQGSTLTSAETGSGKIQYTQYQPNNTNMSERGFSVMSLSSNVTFNTTTKAGSIEIPSVLGQTETVSTTDGYNTVAWAGPLTSGSYKFQGNVLMGCNPNAVVQNDATQVFVSSSLQRLKAGAIDDMNNTTFDLYDCASLKQGTVNTLKIASDGSLTFSNIDLIVPKNQVFDMLNPESYPGILVNNLDYATRGTYSGHAYRYTNNGTSKYVIVIQTNAASLGNNNPYHYMLAVQR